MSSGELLRGPSVLTVALSTDLDGVENGNENSKNHCLVHGEEVKVSEGSGVNERC